MKKLPPALAEPEQDEPGTRPLTAQEAQRLRQQQPPVSVWWVVAAQVLVGVVAAAVAWAWTGERSVAWSLAYGALAVAVPAGVYARAVTRAAASAGAGAGLLLWEMVKLGLTVAFLAAAPKLVPGLSWLALLAGVILATKMYWVALLMVRRPRRTGN